MGMGRSSTCEQTTATLPSIPPRCSRLYTQPPSNPTSIGCSAFSANATSWAGEEQASSASSRLLHSSLLTALVGEPPDLFRTDLGSTQLLQQMTGYSVWPGAARQPSSLL